MPCTFCFPCIRPASSWQRCEKIWPKAPTFWPIGTFARFCRITWQPVSRTEMAGAWKVQREKQLETNDFHWNNLNGNLFRPSGGFMLCYDALCTFHRQTHIQKTSEINHDKSQLKKMKKQSAIFPLKPSHPNIIEHDGTLPTSRFRCFCCTTCARACRAKIGMSPAVSKIHTVFPRKRQHQTLQI